MKTIIVVFALAFLSVATYGQKESLTYAITDSDTLICKNMKKRAFNTKCVLLSGEKIIVPNAAIRIYSNHGRIMEKLPVYLNGKKTNKMAMMEFIGQRKGVKIYKYEYFNGAKESLDAVFVFYHDNTVVATQTNPSISKLNNYLARYNTPDARLLSVE